MSSNTALAPEQSTMIQRQEQELSSLLEGARGYVIDCHDLAEAAVTDLNNVAKKRKEITDFRMSITRPLDAAKKAVMDRFRPLEITLEDIERELRGKIGEWNRKERERLEAEKRAAEAEARRIAEEAARQAEEARKAAEEAASNGNNMLAEQLDNEAAVLEDSATMIQSMAPAVAAAPAKLAGIATVVNWKFEVTDKMALIKAVAAGEVSPDVIDVNTTEIRKRVTAMKADFRAPGVRVYSEEDVKRTGRG